MPHFLVTARPRSDRIDELRDRLVRREFLRLEPFGRALSRSLQDARCRDDGLATWEEEDYCRPPLAEERAAVLDDYFDELKFQLVRKGTGWRRIDALPRLFPDLPAFEASLAQG